ncbi:TPT-domain-containing protein [Gyrodon lividus]|nr:TPT-domain-containing protein [Gyrodon lividus]
MSSPSTVPELVVSAGHSRSVSITSADLGNDGSPHMKEKADRHHESFASKVHHAGQHTTIPPGVSEPSSLFSHQLDGHYPQSLNHLHVPYSKERKSPRRTYFDYGVTTSSHPGSRSPSPNSLEHTQDLLTSRHSLSQSLMSRNPYTLPWELPSPSHSRISIYNPAAIYDKDFRTKWHWFYHSQPFWLVLYFCFNLGLTLYNKGVLIHFPFAYTLTALHALCGSIGGFVLLKLGAYVPAKLTDADNLALVAFSVLYTVNIAVSNLSLQLVTIPFHQVVRAATPIFTIFLSMFLFGTRSSSHKVASLVPVIVGVGLATYGDYDCTTSGFLLTVLGTLLAAMKTIYTSILQSQSSLSNPSFQVQSAFRYIIPPRLHLHPLDLLTRMAPLAFIQCVTLAHMSGELERVQHWSAHEMTPWKAVALGLNGAIAFGLNIVSFTANKKAGPLSMTVAANVKQVLSIVLAVGIFDLSISGVNAMGILLTLVGGAWYASVEYQEKKARGRGR